MLVVLRYYVRNEYPSFRQHFAFVRAVSERPLLAILVGARSDKVVLKDKDP